MIAATVPQIWTWEDERKLLESMTGTRRAASASLVCVKLPKVRGFGGESVGAGWLGCLRKIVRELA